MQATDERLTACVRSPVTHKRRFLASARSIPCMKLVNKPASTQFPGLCANGHARRKYRIRLGIRFPPYAWRCHRACSIVHGLRPSAIHNPSVSAVPRAFGIPHATAFRNARGIFWRDVCVRLSRSPFYDERNHGELAPRAQHASAFVKSRVLDGSIRTSSSPRIRTIGIRRWRPRCQVQPPGRSGWNHDLEPLAWLSR